MNKEVLYFARKSIVSGRFLRRIFVTILGIAIMILGGVMMGMVGKSVGSVVVIAGLILMLIGALLSLIEAMIRRSNKIEFYKDKYVVKSGIINKQERQVILTNVMGTSMRQTWYETIVNSGTVKIDIVGKGDITLEGVKNPTGLKNYLEQLIQKTDYSGMKQVIQD